jgi:nucleoside-diphosphate-sugar epimerase
MKIVVIGGTGLIGSKTVAILRQGGHEVVAASPKSGINTITGEGLKEAIQFESDMPSQAVASLWGASDAEKYARHCGELP